jgi:ribosome-interacting GTPase 1
VPATTRIGGVLVQLVEIPGLLEGAHDGRGGGRALLGVLRSADGILYCNDAGAPAKELAAVVAEVRAAGIDRPAAVAATKCDEADGTALRAAFPELEVVEVSVLDDGSLDRLRDLLWRMTGLVRIHLRSDDDPVALRPPVRVIDVADAIHHELAARCTGAKVWGASAKFPGQRLGPAHVLADGDAVEILD